VLGELAVFDANDVGGDPGGGSAIAGEGPVRGPERWKMRFLHREIAAMHKSGSGTERTCRPY
jgi:hypothetical protein